jgi:hypothetical protein
MEINNGPDLGQEEHFNFFGAVKCLNKANALAVIEVNVRDVQLEHLNHPFRAFIVKHGVLGIFRPESLQTRNSELLDLVPSSFVVKLVQFEAYFTLNWSFETIGEMFGRLETAFNVFSNTRYFTFNCFCDSFCD